jgi:hypothetical protein
MNEFAALVQNFGLPMALFIVLTVSGAAQVWVWGWQIGRASCRERVSERV